MVPLYRRVCVLRARGLFAEAEELHRGEFAQALAAVEARITPNEVTQAQLQVLLAAEEERVANASVLAALLAPMLGDKLRGEVALFPSSSDPTHAGSVHRPARGNESLGPELASTPSRPPLSIADFIDGMLQQEKTPATRPPQRRAS